MARQPANSGKQLSRRIAVLVNRDPMLKTPTVIWQHEKAILEAMFGDGNVTDIDPSTMDDGYSATVRPDMLVHNKTQDVIQRPSDSAGLGFVFIGDPGVEYDRLAAAYGRMPDENRTFVEHIYGRSQDKKFANLVGQPELADLPLAQLRGLVLDYGYAPIPHKDASAEEKSDAYKRRKELADLPLAGLVKIAEDLGVQVG